MALVLCPVLEHLELGGFHLSLADIVRVERWVAWWCTHKAGVPRSSYRPLCLCSSHCLYYNCQSYGVTGGGG